MPASAICADDIAHWPYSPSLLVKWVSFLGTLGLDLGVGGISYVELLILYELWAGERLALEKAHPRYLRHGRPISISAVPFGPGTDIWRSCRFIGAMMRSLCMLPGGLGRFVPLLYGLTSRPRESSSAPFLNELLRLFGYPSGSAGALLCGDSSFTVLHHSVCQWDPHLEVASGVGMLLLWLLLMMRFLGFLGIGLGFLC